MPKNAELAQRLDEIARMMDVLGEDSFRSAANARAARTIGDLATPIEDVARDRKALVAIDGIGAKIADKIEEFCATGRIREHEELRGKVPSGVLALMDVPGLGPKTVRVMWQLGKIESVADLEKSIADGSILKLPRMGEKSVEKIRASLAFAKQAGQRLWLGQAQVVADAFVARMEQVAGVARVAFAGSLRRGKETIGDIDILVALGESPGRAGKTAAKVGPIDLETANAVSEVFRTSPGVVQVIASGETKSSVRVTLENKMARWKLEGDGESETPGVQVDLRILPLASWGAALMYFTGSKEHNVRLRERALSMGMTLNEWGLFEDDDPKKEKAPPQTRGLKPVAAESEEAVYAALGLSWIPPEAREDRGELGHAGEWGLIELSDIKAELHAHTTASDGSLSIEELARRAKERGFHTIAVTDHSKSSVQANGLSVERLLAHVEAVHKARDKVKGIAILAGSEVDILADGTLDYEDKVLAKLDVVVASPHTALSQEPEAATKRLLAAIRHPRVHILGHPTGRLVMRRAGLSPDMPRLFAAAKEHGVALEINAHWMRLDLRDQHVRAAQEAGCLIAIDCDVHEGDDFGNLRFGVATARRGWLRAESCVNTWGAKRLREWLAKKG